MNEIHPYINKLLQAVSMEEKEEINRYSLDQQHTLKTLKSEGLAIHPIQVTRKNFGYADYPEISFRIAFPTETNHFMDGASIECFIQGEQPVKGVLMNLEGKTGEFRLFAPDFPDWIEDNGVGIKVAVDQRTITIMKTKLNGLKSDKRLYPLFERLHGNPSKPEQITISSPPDYINNSLNASQQQAVSGILQGSQLTIIHGPPGTGKTTTLAEVVQQLVGRGEKVLISAPSNTAVDNIAKKLIKNRVKILRVGNSNKVDPEIFPYTPEGKLSNPKQLKEIKDLKKRAEEFRRMALKYKRSFGRAEREQRDLLFKEVKQIRSEIKKLQAYNEEKLYSESEVIMSTPIGLYDANIKHLDFQTLVIDEAGQCIEPLAWCIFPLASRYVLAGDHWQLPPTVLSREASQMGLNKSILEVCMEAGSTSWLLNIQYRMREAIAGFSSIYFYKGLLQTPARLFNTGNHITFIDTAGAGLNERKGNQGLSLQNEGELDVAQKLMETEALDPSITAFISPYSGQVAAAKEKLPGNMRISTIDSFQGQEKENIILSLVRSNDEGEIGFLKDYRRMNVAITRAQERLFIIGDSATIASDPFYLAFLEYIELHGNYRTVWD